MPSLSVRLEVEALTLWISDVSGARPTNVSVVNDFSAPLRLTGPDDLLGLLPHLIGFHPRDSLALVVIDGSHVGVTARVDLAAMLTPRHTRALIGQLTARFPDGEVCAVAYTGSEDDAWLVLRRCARILGRRLLISLHAHPNGWWADRRRGPRVSFNPESSRAAAEATVRGMQARTSREALAALAAGPDEAEWQAASDRLDAACEELAPLEPQRWPQRLRDTVAACAARPPTDEECAELGVLLCEPNARDVELVALDKATAEHRLALWSRVVNRIPEEVSYGPLGLLGLAAWLTGNGALASVCLERLDVICPRSGLRAMLADIVGGMIPPTAWPTIVADLRAHAAAPPGTGEAA